jgi:hypothetical protein
MVDTMETYWWCDFCHEECNPIHVTSQEMHECCGHPVRAITHSEDTEVMELRRIKVEMEQKIGALQMERDAVEEQWRRMRDERDAVHERNEELVRFALDGARDALQKVLVPTISGICVSLCREWEIR